ncbi:MAG: cadmium-translocating P-type ATPase [Clostridia bacterium]|nr:cadmium-translocating P-type ATPase [Clostridia bacterium]
MTRKQKKSLWRIIGAVLLLAAAFVAERLLPENTPLWCVLFCYLPAYLLVGYDVLWRAVRGIAHGQVFDESFLMALATLGALAIGFLPGGEPEFAEGVFVMLFYQTGELFQKIAVGKSRRAIAALMDMRPDTARVLRDGQEVVVSPDEVAVAEVLVVRPGEKIALDGVILSGSSDMNTLALTGESLPTAVAAGDRVISGCSNMTGLLTVRVEKPYAESTVSRILELMGSAASRKSQSERFITRFAKYYTPCVVILAVLLALVPPLLSGSFAASIVVWLTRALTFLVVSCPCALVISVPLAFFGGMGGASRMGVLVKGSNYLEALANAEVVVFDKTGTLTTGAFSVASVHPVGVSGAELLRLAASAEAGSNHPVAKAIASAVASEALLVPQSVTEVAGKGVYAMLAGEKIAAGNAALMQELGLAPEAPSTVGTVVFVARGGTYIGAIVVADTLKEGSAEAIAALAACGVRRTVMLTGDRRAIAEKIAGEVGISEYRAELLPADKMREVEVLLALPRKGRLVYVGDGINDAPSLARADVGVAMGGLGSDAAIEAADIVLMDDDPRKLARAIGHARRTLAIVRQNIALALGVKGAVLVCSALGLLGALQMPLAIFADVGVAVLAILNAMRCLHSKN